MFIVYILDDFLKLACSVGIVSICIIAFFMFAAYRNIMILGFTLYG